MPEFLRRLNLQPLTFFGTLFLLVAGLSLAKSVLIPLALAILLSFLLNPLVCLMQRHGLKRIPAVVVVAVAAFALMGMLLYAVLAQVFTLANHLPEYEKITLKKVRAGEGSPISKFFGLTTRVTEEMTKVTKSKEGDPRNAELSVLTVSTIGSLGTPTGQAPLVAATALYPGRSPSLAELAVPKRAPPVVVQSDPMAMLSFFAATAQEFIRLIASAGLIIVLVIVMLIFREEVRDRFIRLAGSGRLTVTTKALDEASQRIGDYMLRKTIVNGVFGAVVAAVLFVIGVPFAVMWGFLLAVLRFIPGLGIWLSAAAPALLSLIAFESWWPFTLVAVAFLLGELLMVNVFEPRFVGPQIGLLPVATIVSLSFWTWLWGPVGLLLAIPITMCLAVLGKYVPQLQFLTIVLSDQPAMDPTLRYYQRLLANDEDEAMEIVDHFVAKNGCNCVYDELLIPAVSYARRDVALGDLPESELDFFFQTTAEILDDLRLSEGLELETKTAPEFERSYSIVGCPIGDRGCLFSADFPTSYAFLANWRS